MESAFQAWLQAWWAPALAFAAGVVSFASPCVVPLIPGYLSFISGGHPAPEPARVSAAIAGGAGPGSGGQTAESASGPESSVADGRSGSTAPAVFFVLGFAAVFTAMGAFTATFQPLFRSELGLRIAGGVVLAFGTLMLLYALRLGGAWLYAERRPFLARLRPGRGAAFPLGMAFAAGWTPCIGPVLAGILSLAAAQGGGAWGAMLMLSYSLGLGLPFVLLALGARRLLGAVGFLRRNYHWVAGIGGAAMVAIGVLLVLNLWQELLVRTGLLRFINRFSPPI